MIDGTGRITEFDAGGAYRRSATVRLNNIGSFAVMPDGFLVSGSGNNHLVHVVGADGSVIRSFRPEPRSYQLHEGNFMQAFATRVGGVIVTIKSTANEVQFLDERDQREWRSSALNGRYTPPAWPKEMIPDLRQLADWGNNQTWVRILFPLGDSTVLISASRYDAVNDRARVTYSLMSTSGRELAVTRESAYIVDSIVHDTVYDVTLDGDGITQLARLHITTSSRAEK